MKKLLVVCLSGMMLFAGCSAKEEIKQTVCTGDANGVKITTSLDHEGDKILKQVNTNVIVYTDLGSDITKADLEPLAKEASAAYSGIKGVSYEYTLGDTEMTETTTIDYTAADFTELMSVGIIFESDEKIDFISLEETVKANEELGITCK